MKRSMIKTAIFFAVGAFFVVALNSCDKGFSSSSFGNNYIYMPQATATGGLNLNYPVDSSTNNCRVDSINQKVNVFLGVSVSGEQASAGFTVNISVNNDTTNQIISGGSIPNAVIIPATMYTLPSSVTVSAGQHFATFNLTMDASALKTFAGKMALLTVQISNPTSYALNTTYNKTVVVINVNSLHLH